MRSRQSLLCILAAVVVVITAAGSNAIELVGRATMVQADSIPMGLPGDTVWDFSGVRPLPGSKTWFASKMGDSVLAVACGDSQLTYLERNDSLYWLGFENPSTEMRETGTVRAARPSAIAAGVQPCKYTGKKLDREAGLDLYDFAARQLDPALGRTTTQDPMAEKYYSISPYAWCAGNPIRNTDPTGNWIVGIRGKKVSYDNRTKTWKNATKDIMELGNEMAKTKAGMQVLRAMLYSKHPISLIFNKTSVIKLGNSYVMGQTSPRVVVDKNGKRHFKSVSITFFMKVINDKSKWGVEYTGLSESDVLGTVGVHEGEHGTNEKASSNFYSHPKGDKTKHKVEENAEEKEQQHLEQLKLLKTQEENNK